VIQIAELRFQILGDLSKLRRDLTKLFKKKFKIDVEGEGKGESKKSKEQKKQTGFLAGILKRIAPLAILSRLKVIQDLLKVILGYAVLGIMESIKWIKKLPDGLQTIWTMIVEWTKWGFNLIKDKLLEWHSNIVEWIKGLPGRIWGWLKALPGLIWEKMTEGFEWIKTKLVTLTNIIIKKFKDLKDKVIETLKTLPGLIWDKVQALAGMIGNVIKGAIDDLNPFRNRESKVSPSTQSRGIQYAKDLYAGKNPKPYSVNDAIITKDGKIVRTNPNDTIIATQNPGGSGGITNLNFYGVTQEKFLQEVEIFLSQRNLKASRF